MKKIKENEDTTNLQTLRTHVESKLDESNLMVENKLSHLKIAISNFLSDYDNSQKYHDQLIEVLTKIDKNLGITYDDKEENEEDLDE